MSGAGKEEYEIGLSLLTGYLDGAPQLSDKELGRDWAAKYMAKAIRHA
jgi:hypothetical protein